MASKKQPPKDIAALEVDLSQFDLQALDLPTISHDDEPIQKEKKSPR